MSRRNYLSKLSDVKSPSEEVSARTDKGAPEVHPAAAGLCCVHAD